MAQRNPIQVPDRGDDEPPATPEQLQFIRHLVTGMSLRGFRFDYRKLGQQQAAEITDQLIRIRDAGGAVQAPRRKSSGCVGGLFRGVTNLIILVLVVAGITGGGYLIWQQIQDQNTTNGQADDEETTDDPASGFGDVEMFPGLGSSGDPADEAADPQSTPPREREPEPAPNSQPPITPAPDPQRVAAASQATELEKVLVQLSQATRSEYAQRVRQTVSENMLARLDEMPALAALIQRQDAGLLERIRALITAYADNEIDGEAIRSEVDALRERLRVIVETIR